MKINNEKYGLNIELVTGNADDISGFAKLLFAKGVNNYFALAGKDCADLEKSSQAAAEILTGEQFSKTTGQYFDRSTKAARSSGLSYSEEYAKVLWDEFMRLIE